MKSLVDEESSRNLTGVERKGILGQHFLVGEGKHVCFMQGMECGYRADGVGHRGEATRQNEQQEITLRCANAGASVNPLRYSSWEIPWAEKPGQAIVHGVAKESDTT